MKGSMFAPVAGPLPEELIEVLCATQTLRVERIVTHGQASPEGFWYDQADSEFVLLMQGAADLELEGQEAPVHLDAGDYLFLKPHQRHRVSRVSKSEAVIWLAIHFRED